MVAACEGGCTAYKGCKQLFALQHTEDLTAAGSATQTVRETSAMYEMCPAKAMSVLRWVVAALGRETSKDSTVAEAVILPRVPWVLAMCLKDGGLNITHQQLVTAAQRHAAGVEVWATAVIEDQDRLVRACCCNRLELVS